MNGAKRKFGLKHGLALVVALGLIAGLALAYVVASGIADLWARRAIVDRLEKSTGARVELGDFHFLWRSLGARFGKKNILFGKSLKIGPIYFDHA